MHTDHDAPNADVNPESLKLGHEPDIVSIRTILYVPVALVITFAMTYGIVTLIVNYTRAPSKEPVGNAIAAKRNEDPLADRLNRISSDPRENPDVRTPRLDGLDRLTTNNNNPPFVQSSDKTKTGNSPEYHPEELRPFSEHGKKLGLLDFSWKDKEKGLVRIPIGDALKILAEGASYRDADADAKKLYQKWLKFENKVNPQQISANRPTGANPQWGIKVMAESKTESKSKAELKGGEN